MFKWRWNSISIKPCEAQSTSPIAKAANNALLCYCGSLGYHYEVLLLVGKTRRSIKCIIWVLSRPEMHPAWRWNGLSFNVMEKKRTIHQGKGSRGVGKRKVNSVPWDSLVSACRQCLASQSISDAQGKSESAFFSLPLCCGWVLDSTVLSRTEDHVLETTRGLLQSLPLGSSPTYVQQSDQLAWVKSTSWSVHTIKC